MNKKFAHQVENEYSKVFDKDKLYNNLALSSLYLATFELLKSSIIINIRNFFSRGEVKPEEKQPVEYLKEMKVYFEKYKKQKDKEYLACCDWLKDMKAINKEDWDHLMSIKKQRNEIAHELPYFLLESQRNIDICFLVKAKELIGKIDRWWVINVDVSINLDYWEEMVEEKDILSGREIILDHIFNLFLKKNV